MAKSPLFSRLVGRVVPDVIRRLTGDADDRTDPAAPITSPEDEPPRMLLEDLLKEDLGTFGGKMHIISLVEFREAIGSERWLKLSRNIMMIAEGVLRSRLGHAHSYVQRGTDMFLLGFHDLGEVESKLRAIALAEEIGGRLAGANFGAKQALVRTGEVDPEDLLTADGEIDDTVLEAAAEEAQAVAPATEEKASAHRTFWQTRPAERAPPRKLPTVDSSVLKKEPERRQWDTAVPARRSDGNRRLWETQGAGADYDEPAEPVAISEAAALEAAKPVHRPLVQPLSEAERRHFEAMHGGMLATLGPADYARAAAEGTLDRTKDPDPAPPAEPEPEPEAEEPVDVAARAPGAVEAALRPCWTAKSELVDIFLLRATLTGGSIPAGETREPAALHDAMVAAKAAETIIAMGEAGVKAVLAVPLHCVSLADPARRTEVLGVLSRAPHARRMQGLRVELVGITAATPAGRVMQAIEALRPVVREVALRTDLLAPSRAVFGLRGVLVGADAERIPPQNRAPEQLDAAMRILAEKTRLGGGKGTFVWGLRKRAEIIAALDAGVDQVGGPAFSRDIPPPGKVVRLLRHRLVGKP